MILLISLHKKSFSLFPPALNLSLCFYLYFYHTVSGQWLCNSMCNNNGCTVCCHTFPFSPWFAICVTVAVLLTHHYQGKLSIYCVNKLCLPNVLSAVGDFIFSLPQIFVNSPLQHEQKWVIHNPDHYGNALCLLSEIIWLLSKSLAYN